jgi:hypothetical protein
MKRRRRRRRRRGRRKRGGGGGEEQKEDEKEEQQLRCQLPLDAIHGLFYCSEPVRKLIDAGLQPRHLLPGRVGVRGRSGWRRGHHGRLRERQVLGISYLPSPHSHPMRVKGEGRYDVPSTCCHKCLVCHRPRRANGAQRKKGVASSESGNLNPQSALSTP